MLETLVAQRNKTYPGFVADRGRETKGVLWAPLPSIILMSPSRVRRTWSCDSWGHVSSEASFPCLWPSMEGLVFPGTAEDPAGQAHQPFPLTVWMGHPGVCSGVSSMLSEAGFLERCGSAPQTRDRLDWRLWETSVSRCGSTSYPGTVSQRSSGFASSQNT